MSKDKRLSICIAAIAFLVGCDSITIEDQIVQRFPTEVESCICRHLAFEADGFTGLPYPKMVSQCNETIRTGHPSLPDSTESNPDLDDLRCTADVDDWRGEMKIFEAQQESNRQNLKEFLRD